MGQTKGTDMQRLAYGQRPSYIVQTVGVRVHIHLRIVDILWLGLHKRFFSEGLITIAIAIATVGTWPIFLIVPILEHKRFAIVHTIAIVQLIAGVKARSHGAFCLFAIAIYFMLWNGLYVGLWSVCMVWFALHAMHINMRCCT